MQHHYQYCRELEKEKHPDIPLNELNIELPPLDAALVTFILVLMSRYITQYHLIEESTNLEQNQHNMIPIPDMINDNESGYTYEQVKLSLLSDIYKSSSKILYYVSSSNWEACYAKIKNAVISLDSVHGGSSDDIPPEIRMLECCCLTRDRLYTIFAGKVISFIFYIKYYTKANKFLNRTQPILFTYETSRQITIFKINAESNLAMDRSLPRAICRGLCK